jgi:hypothetical protein
MAIETLEYRVIKKQKNIEIRQYSSYIKASVTFATKEEYDRLAFKTLANYIFGENIKMTTPVLEGENIGMTSPVIMETSKSSWTMAFTMPSRYTMDTLPLPKNKNIKIYEVPENLMATFRYSGFRTEAKFKKYEAKLKNWLESNESYILGKSLSAGYNPPWTLPFFRRNEVLIELD